MTPLLGYESFLQTAHLAAAPVLLRRDNLTITGLEVAAETFWKRTLSNVVKRV